MKRGNAGIIVLIIVLFVTIIALCGVILYFNFNNDELNINNGQLNNNYSESNNENVDNNQVEKSTYLVKFDTDGGDIVTSQTVEKGKTVTKPNNPTRAGYNFKEWTLNGKSYDFTSAVNSDITIKAVWEKIEYVTITFNTDGGSKVSTQTIEKGKVATKPSNPTKSGYVFCGWSLNEGIYNFSSVVNSNIELKAIWKAPEVDIEQTLSSEQVELNVQKYIVQLYSKDCDKYEVYYKLPGKSNYTKLDKFEVSKIENSDLALDFKCVILTINIPGKISNGEVKLKVRGSYNTTDGTKYSEYCEKLLDIQTPEITVNQKSNNLLDFDVKVTYPNNYKGYCNAYYTWTNGETILGRDDVSFSLDKSSEIDYYSVTVNLDKPYYVEARNYTYCPYNDTYYCSSNKQILFVPSITTSYSDDGKIILTSSICDLPGWGTSIEMSKNNSAFVEVAGSVDYSPVYSFYPEAGVDYTFKVYITNSSGIKLFYNVTNIKN